jgi:hypothetical protein
LLTGTRVFLFGYRPRSIVGSGYSRSISAGGSWRPYLLVFRVWLIRSLTPPKTELPATIANRRPKLEKYRGSRLNINKCHSCQTAVNSNLTPFSTVYFTRFCRFRIPTAHFTKFYVMTINVIHVNG